MTPENRKLVEQLYGQYNVKLHLKEWESVANIVPSETMLMVGVNTYEVKVLVREDRYNRKGMRVLIYTPSAGKWVLESERTLWDDDFEPFVFEKIGRRKTADELIEQREWETMCYRPGNSRTPLDSYERVLDPFVRSTDRMEKHY